MVCHLILYALALKLTVILDFDLSLVFFLYGTGANGIGEPMAHRSP
jgi:hypothetical protein